MKTKKKTRGERMALMRKLAREFCAEREASREHRQARPDEARPTGSAHKQAIQRDRREFFEKRRTV